MFLKYWQPIDFIKKTKTQQSQQKTSASHQFATSGTGVGNEDGVCKFWKMFLLFIQGLESKRVHNRVDPGATAAARGQSELPGGWE